MWAPVQASVYYAVRPNSLILFNNLNISSVLQYRGYTFYELIINKNRPHISRNLGRPRPGGIEQTVKGGEGRGIAKGRSHGDVAIGLSLNT